MARLRLPRVVVDVAHLVWGAGASQILLLVSTVVCARWFFTDAEMGELSTAVAVATILGTVATLRLEMAVPLARTGREAVDLARTVMALAAVAGVVVMIGVGAVEASGADSLRSALGGSAGWLGLAVFVTAGYQTLRMLQTRLGQFKAASTANVAGSAVMGLLQVLAGIVGLGSGGLTAAYSLGRLVTDVQMARQAGFAAVGRMRWWLVAKWRRMPTWLLVPALLNAVSVGAVAPLIQVWYGKEVAGQMGLSQRLLMAPAALLGQAVAGVFFARFAVMVREGASTTASVTRVARALVAVALPVFVPFILLGPEIFSLLVGPDWALAGTVSGLLAPWLMVNFVSSPLSGYATVENRLPRLFVLSLIEAGLRIPALATGLVIGDVRSAIALYSLSGLLISGYWVGWVARLARASWMTVFGLAVPVIVVLASALSLAAVRSALSANLYLAVSVTVAILVAIGSGLAVVRTIRRGADAT